MSHSRPLRSLVAVLAAIAAVVALSLTMTGNAAAAGAGPRTHRTAAPDPHVDKIQKDGRWTIEELEKAAAPLGEFPFALGNPFGY